MAEGGRNSQGRGRSRRRRGSRRRETAAAVLLVLLVLLIVSGVLFAGTYVYRYWDGNRTSTVPLESSREIVPETMKGYR